MSPCNWIWHAIIFEIVFQNLFSEQSISVPDKMIECGTKKRQKKTQEIQLFETAQLIVYDNAIQFYIFFIIIEIK